jgi:hypothetical protein
MPVTGGASGNGTADDEKRSRMYKPVAIIEEQPWFGKALTNSAKDK